MRQIDLRSDTVTRPSEAMLDAMARAEVGDDVYGEDPTINRLQELAAARLGKEAALFVPSGTMGNQVSLAAHTQPGDAVIAGQGVHMFLHEAAAGAAISGVQFTLVGADGFFGPEDVRASAFPDDQHFPRTRLVCIENTHNSSGGRVFPLPRVLEVAAAARELNLVLHLDGARIFNVEVATGIPAADWAAPFDSVSFCLSKGLGAPIGSLVVGTNDFIAKAHKLRKMLGGGMRQVGSLGAAGIYALEHNVKRLEEDHANARHLAEGLHDVPGVDLVREPETNMVLFRPPEPATFSARIRERGLLINANTPGVMRAVTHLDVSRDDVGTALEIIRAACT